MSLPAIDRASGYVMAVADLSLPQDLGGQPLSADRLQQPRDVCHAEHERICLDSNARNIRPAYAIPADDKRTSRARQMLVDPKEQNDWTAEFETELARCREAAQPVLRLVRLRSLT